MPRNSLLKLDKSRRQVRLSKPRIAILGDEAGNVYDDTTGMYLLRYRGPADENGNATLGTVFRAFGGAANFIERPGREVRVVTDAGGQKEIIGPVWSDLQKAGIKPYSTHPNTPYRQFQRLSEIQNFMARAVNMNTMKVRVGELMFVDRFGVPQWFKGTNESTHIDLTPYIPTTADYECVVLVSFDQDAFSSSTPPYFTMSVSTPQAILPPSAVGSLDITDVKEAYVGRTPYSLPVQIFRLYNGMTRVGGDPFDRDERQFVNVPATDANPNTIVITSEDDSVMVTEGPIGTFNLSVASGGGMTDFEIDADDGANLTIDDSVPWKAVGGTGIKTTNSGADTTTFDLENTAITPGAVAYPASITFDQQGRATNATPGSAPAPLDATYIVQTPSATLTNEQALSALATGMLKVTAGTGVLSTATANADYVPPTGGILTSPVINTGISGTAIDNDATLAANSSTLLPTQQAVKSYVDAVAQGLSVKLSVIAATTTALPTNTYSNGTAGVGATLTGSATGVLTVDGQAIALNDRVLIKDEAAASHNGIYKCTTAGAVGVAYVLTRATDMNQPAEIPGAFVFVENGTVNDANGFVVADPGPFVIGTTAIAWTQFSGAGQIVAGTGLQKSGNTLSIDNTVATLSGAQALTNKTITASSLIATALSLLIGGFKAVFSHANTADRTYTFPDVDGTVTLNAATQTLAGKTLTSPTIGDFTNAGHQHTNAATGGQLTDAALSAPVTIAKGGTNASTAAAGFDNLAPTTTAGDLIYRNASTNTRLPKGTSLQQLRMNVGATAPEWFTPTTGKVLTPVWTSFTTPGAATYNMPADAVFFDIIVVAGGSGGGSGRRTAAATPRGGGGGGAAGGVTVQRYAAGQLPSASYDLYVGNGGAGAAAVTTDNTAGNVGSQGEDSFFGGASAATALQYASASSGALGGGRGGAAAAANGGIGVTTPSAAMQVYGANGGVGGIDAVTSTTGSSSAYGPGSGGGGGGISSGNVVFTGSQGGTGAGASFRAINGGGGAGGSAAAGTAGANGSAPSSSPLIFGSGGGGGGPSAGAGRAGGNGGLPGGGGGGGSGATNGNATGAGGNGGSGAVFICAYVLL